jgi:DNA-binding NarL/FixJ family response regulator
MDQAMNTRLRDPERLQRVADAMGNGVVLVDSGGKVVWLDHSLRHRIDGGIGAFALPAVRAEGSTIDCLAVPAELKVNGETLEVCVLRQIEEPRSTNELLAAIESLMADGTSWFGSVVEKLKAMRQVTGQAPGDGQSAADLDVLSNREREVLGLICEGKSDVHMGDLLGLSENTVRNHIASLYRKIGVNRRTAAIIWARERGIRSRTDALSRPRRHNGNGRGHPAAY